MNLRYAKLAAPLALLFLAAAAPQVDAKGTVAADQKTVLITGASSGIGRRMTEALAAEGFYVYAGARKQEDLDALDALDNVRAIRLDVTVQEEIDAAVEVIGAEGSGLYALVNNAGVLITGPSAEVELDAVEWLFDVNVFGVYRVTQAFAPQIVANRGRIVNIGSIAGSIGIRFLAAYSMSKHAIEAYTDALAAELGPFGVHVSVIAPGDYATNIWSSEIDKARMAAVVEDDSPYVKEYRDWIELVAGLELKEPDEVADTALLALTEPVPERRYLVVPDEGEMAWVTGSAVTRLAELNGDHAFSYSAEELTNLLKQAMAEQAGQAE